MNLWLRVCLLLTHVAYCLASNTTDAYYNLTITNQSFTTYLIEIEKNRTRLLLKSGAQEQMTIARSLFPIQIKSMEIQNADFLIEDLQYSQLTPEDKKTMKSYTCSNSQTSLYFRITKIYTTNPLNTIDSLIQHVCQAYQYCVSKNGYVSDSVSITFTNEQAEIAVKD